MRCCCCCSLQLLSTLSLVRMSGRWHWICSIYIYVHAKHTLSVDIIFLAYAHFAFRNTHHFRARCLSQCQWSKRASERASARDRINANVANHIVSLHHVQEACMHTQLPQHFAYCKRARISRNLSKICTVSAALLWRCAQLST